MVAQPVGGSLQHARHVRNRPRKIKPGTPPTVYANPQVSQGGKAELSLNYKKLTTLEIDENGRPFKGSYNLAPLK